MTEFPFVTARELLVDIAGVRHQEHTVVSKSKATKGVVGFRCSCGVSCEVAATPENLRSLALVAETAS